ncbi:MAG: glycoside hydrolase family 18 protein [Reichenbachiella sp.]|uniref:glycoside hydrolase family 18 protein n=1 Tax=Reichenbachiella sp. TaxID=2184521 RepID=UPI0029672B8B|nr:glycoside hydrolase family 18 protein [Reichenbachiella sp.]MDW3209217.1 glycoside hydrolase family 18 protein [Reichenbachiella sp.]
MNYSKHLFFIGIAIFWAACSPKESAVQDMPEDTKPSLDIIAYYSGPGSEIGDYPIDKLDQIIFSFMHLKGNQLTIDNAEDSISLLQITSLKEQYPDLKVLVSLGGWGGCETCSPVFSTDENRKVFAASVVNVLKQYNADGIDLDWEYPAIEGFPGHEYKPEDKQNFTALVQELRAAMGEGYELSFAAGGFDKFLIESVEWDKVMPLFNRVNLMSYDLINGFSTETGHHTALYSNPLQEVSTDYAVQFLDSIGVPLNKIVIGAAFYARVWENVPKENNGLYQSGKFLKGIGYPNLDSTLSADNGFQTYWDSVSMAPYAYSETLHQFATYDNPQSVETKVKYVKDKKLGGIMFWELRNDKKQNGLLDAMYKAANN